MPEGDTVFRTAARLHQALAGEPLTTTDLRWPDLSTLDFRGVPTLEVVSRGKNILQRLGNGVTIHSHLRMEGQWRVDATDRLTARALLNPQIRAVVGAPRPGPPSASGSATCTSSRPPTRAAWSVTSARTCSAPTGTPPKPSGGSHAGPITIGAALLDQRNLAGVGTLYAAEALFLERVHPWTPAADLDEATVAAVVDRAHTLLDRGRRHAVQTTHGQPAAGRDARGSTPGRGVRVAAAARP